MTVVETSPLAAEYAALTERCGLLDRSERGKLALTGASAKEFLNGQVTNDVEHLSEGEGCYAAFLTHKGKMLGDVRILDAGEELLLDTERGALQALFDTIRRYKIGFDVELHKRTLESALFSLIGPSADAVVAQASSGEMALTAPADRDPAPADRDPAPADRDPAPAEEGLAPAAGEHRHLVGRVGGVEARLIRTDVGIDVLCDSTDGDAVQQALLRAGADRVSEQAAEIVRVEHGRPRYGVDIDETTIPQEAGLNEQAVSFTKGCYVGQETVARLYYKGKPNRLLRGLELSEPAAPGAELALGERPVGRLSSSVVSPRLGSIGLALLRVAAEPGTTLRVTGGAVTAVVRELPFA